MSGIRAVTPGRRLTLRLAMVALVAVALLGSSPAAVLGAARSHIKVAIVVGPVGSMTDYYRGLADEAAAVARRSSDNVVTVYTPNATWPRVRRALQGASIVVYLGHGNGWPSPYRDAPFPPTQNGLGLNPVAGGGDEAHQYFGERYLTSVDLAPGAVVILSHLCYASGNPEPGGPDPTLSVARQRADNYAAGWLAAGATAVIAEAHGGAAGYVDAVFRGDASFERIWRSAPTFHDHVVTFDSARTAGAQVMLDPDRPTRGYFRSLVTRSGATAADVLDGEIPPAPPPGDDRRPDAERISLAAQGATFGTPSLGGAPVTGGQSTLTVPLVGKTRELLPDDVSIGVRWDLLLPDGPDPAGPVAPSQPPGANLPAASPSPTPSTEPVSSTPPAVAPGAVPSPVVDSPDLADEPPQIQLVAPELPGIVVVADATAKLTRLTVPVTLPERTGLYRMSTTLHDRDGVAFDAATQALVPALIVRVTGPLWASYAIADTVEATSEAPLVLPVRLANTGSESWSAGPVDEPDAGGTADPAPASLAPELPATGSVQRRPAWLVARWIALDRMADGPLPPSDVSGPPTYLSPGASAVFAFDLVAPSEPGHYLLVIDVVLADRGSLAAHGVPPGLVRVIVAPDPLVPSPDAVAPVD